MSCNISQNNFKNKGLFQCNAGLWCYSYPLIIENMLIGSFIVGHRPIKGNEQETNKVLNETLEKYRINQKDSDILFILLKKEEMVEKERFDDDIKLLEKLSFIESYVTLEHLRSSKDYEKIIAFKNEYESLAHEFLLPIQSIVADSENLMELATKTKNYDIKNLSEDILQEIIKLSFTAEKIRGSVLIDKDNKPSLEFELVNIYDIISETADLFRKEASMKNVKIQVKLTDLYKQIKRNKCEVSKSHIQQVFFNVIHNAVKYSFTSTEFTDRYITIKCDANYDMFICEISNFGIGILPEEIEKIFEKGYRGKLSLDRSRIGSGFGLFKVMEIIKELYYNKYFFSI